MALSATVKTFVDAVNTSIVDTGYAEKYTIAYDASSTDAGVLADVAKLANIPEDQMNKIMGQLNLIVQQRQFRAMFDAEKNGFRRFLVDLTEEGFGIEDVFQEVLDGRAPFWDDNDPQTIGGDTVTSYEDLTTQEKEKIKRKFHITPFERQFKTSTDRRNYSKVFMMASQQRYMDNKLANLSTSAELYLMKSILIGEVKELVESGEIIFNTSHSVANNQGIKNLLESIRATMGGMLQPTTAYNYDGVETVTRSKDDLYIITTPEVFERLKVQTYSGAFNLSEMEIQGKVIYAPNGTNFGADPTTNKPVNFLILDRNAIVVGLKYWLGSNFFVPNKHIVNHWLTIEGIRGYNTFFNAVAYTIDGLSADVNGTVNISIINTASTATDADGAKITYGTDDVQLDSSNDVYAGTISGENPGSLQIDGAAYEDNPFAVYMDGKCVKVGTIASLDTVTIDIPNGVETVVVNIGGYGNPLQ